VTSYREPEPSTRRNPAPLRVILLAVLWVTLLLATALLLPHITNGAG
jgi:hypothetical protein